MTSSAPGAARRIVWRIFRRVARTPGAVAAMYSSIVVGAGSVFMALPCHYVRRCGSGLRTALAQQLLVDLADTGPGNFGHECNPVALGDRVLADAVRLRVA